MSRIDELIKELCPDGVEIKELNDVIISLNTGLNPRQFFKLNTEDAENYYVTIREMHGGEVVFSDKTDRMNDEAMRLCNNRSNLEKGDVLFSGTGTIGETVVLDETPQNLKFMEVLMDYCIMQQKDIEKCALTLMKAFKEEPWNENWTYEQAYTRIDEIMSARVSRGYVVYDGDIVVSMLSGRIMTYLGFKELWVDEFSVHPDYQRQGIGTKMIEYVREQLKQETEKISYIVLNTERGYPSVKFYEANGFKADESLVFMAADV